MDSSETAPTNWPRALAAWLLIVAVETIHGILRRMLLEPMVGELPARQISVLVGSALIFGVAWLSIRWIGARTSADQVRVGFLWVALILVFELGLGSALGYSRERILSDYDVTQGGLMGFGLLFLLFAPALAARVRGLVSV